MFESITVIGSGRVGSAVSDRLRERGLAVGPGGGLVLLCVPDEAIPGVAQELPAGPWVAHVSGATSLAALDPHTHRFSLHPLQTFTRARGPEQLDGAWAAVTAESADAREIGFWLAETLGLRPFPLDDGARPLYHAGAAIASNYLVTLHAVASELFRAAGAPPEALVPLMRRTIENGFELTGPIERGDWETVEAHRRAIRAARPELEPLYDVLARATAQLRARVEGEGGNREVSPPGTPRPAQRSQRRGGRGGPKRRGSVGEPSVPPRERADGERRGRDGAMRTVRTVTEMQQVALSHKVGLVPTMGAFHEGHLSLMRAARAECESVVVSLFVNPTQFAANEDLELYPRDEERDARLATEVGVDVLFVPSAEELYPEGFATWVDVEEAGGEAAARPGHLRGVATVCVKLFNIVRPDVAFFGQKDAQQAAVLRRVVRDLNVDVELRVLPTVRDADGLALSSRNVYLSTAERAEALALPRALETGRSAHVQGSDPIAAARAALNGLEPDYVEVIDVGDARVLAAAARVGSTRLIDNVVLEGELR